MIIQLADNLSAGEEVPVFEKIKALRNDIEHYFSTVNRGAMEGAISDTFLIIRDFIHTELGENPQELLGDAAWAKLLSVSEVFEKERDLCQKALSAIDWESDALAEAERPTAEDPVPTGGRV